VQMPGAPLPKLLVHMLTGRVSRRGFWVTREKCGKKCGAVVASAL
jgi:hypothetical protein